MLEKPDLPDDAIAACLRESYGLHAAAVEFLPLGADVNTAVYRAAGPDGTPYFVKLRRGPFDEISVLLPRLLYDQGVTQVIPPLPARSGQLWAGLREFKLMVFPFVEGRNGYEVSLLEPQWVELGRVLKALHTAHLPPAVRERIPQETYSDQWRARVRDFLNRAMRDSFGDPVAADMADFLRANHAQISGLVRQAETLAAALREQPRPLVVCHADIHAGNVLIHPGGVLYVVDWDTLTLAPRERDLMFAGGGLFGGWRPPQEEETLFYEGYGPAEVDLVALAYYRCERIVQDVAEYCQQILMSDAGGPDRPNGLQQFKGQFGPGAVIELAYQTAQRLPPHLRPG